MQKASLLLASAMFLELPQARNRLILCRVQWPPPPLSTMNRIGRSIIIHRR